MNTKNNIILSICMPTYNRSSHIYRQINYFINEIEGKYEDKVEVIISNNASKDNTEIVLDKYKGKYDWLLINSNDSNIGAYNNMLLLIKMAKGKYVWIPGDDDYLKHGLIDSLMQIILVNTPSYIYLSRRTINESDKKVDNEGKRHCVEYDQNIKISHELLVNLVCENFGDLKFQTSSVFLKENVDKYEVEIDKFPLNVRADCHSLFRAIRSMQDGLSYFISDISVLNGNELSWSEKVIDYMSVDDPLFVEGLESFNFSKKECKNIAKRQKAAAIAFYLSHSDVFNQWRNKGYPGWSVSLIPSVFYLFLRKVARIIGFSKSHKIEIININDFL